MLLLSFPVQQDIQHQCMPLDQGLITQQHNFSIQISVLRSSRRASAAWGTREVRWQIARLRPHPPLLPRKSRRPSKKAHSVVF